MTMNNEPSYELGDVVELNREGITVNVVVEDIRNSFGHHEYKVIPLGESVKINRWVRKFGDN